MKISTGRTVSIEYTMSFKDGKIINTNAGEDGLSFVQGQHEIFQRLELALDGLEKGDSTMVVLEPEQAYGRINPDEVVVVSVEQLPEDAREIGAMVETTDSRGQTITGAVTELHEDNATIDFNHPLAGQIIQFDIKVLAVAEGGESSIA